MNAIVSLPVLPFIVSTVVLLVATIVLLFVLKAKNKYPKIIRDHARGAKGLWKKTLEHSADYVLALGLNEKDLKDTGNFRKEFLVKIPGGKEIKIIYADVCCADYEDDRIWVNVLQAMNGTNMKFEGGGTTKIGVLDENEHRLVLQAIKNRDVKMK